MEESQELEIYSNSNVALDSLPWEIRNLAKRLAVIHSRVLVTKESRGIHLYLPDPELLQEDGEKELYNAHLAVNADKYFGLGDYSQCSDEEKEKLKGQCCMSMKTSKIYSVEDLLNMTTLLHRDLDFSIPRKAKLILTKNDHRLETDKYGNRIPMLPGMLTPINELPEDHPAVYYVKNRGYDPDALWKQFNCSYCYAEEPESRVTGVFYKKLAGGFKTTPQGRLIFFVYVNGVRWGWQARILDIPEHNGYKWMWHPYQQTWSAIAQIMPDSSLQYIQPFSDTFKPAKYFNPPGATRSMMLMGYDAAVEWNASRLIKTCILVEGPLDAARIGPPAIAILGKFLSKDQAALIQKAFDRVVIIPDNDIAGQKGLDSMRKALIDMEQEIAILPSKFKDIGEMTSAEAENFIRPYIEV